MITVSKSLLSLSGVLLAGSLLTGCTSGTTYGTGVTHEQQTIEDLANLITFQKKRPNIDYRSRPDLIVPDDKVLVTPQDGSENLDDQEWPESPQERIARLRADAEAAETDPAARARYEENLRRFRSTKPGEGVERIEAPIGQGIPNVSCDPNGEFMRRCTPDEISKAVRAERREIKSVGKTGYQRRYLTEPPIEYRTPSDTAPIGDEGYTAAELKRINAEKRKRELEQSMRPNG